FRTFVGRGDTKILVGRGADRNDELTFDVARPHHAWLHAKGEAGAHVVVCVKKGAELTQEQLVDAAHLAAHFSKARGETLVDVSYTYRRYVRKPRKSPPGMVLVDREKVITVRLQPERIEKLLATEQA
ncbi:MAG: NFACT RNA binding domain-containing protein, partial [Polyangiaceae bacterium]